MWPLAILFLAPVICNFADGAPTAPDPPLPWPLPTSRSVDFTISHSHHCYTMMLMKENSSIHQMKHEDSATSSKHRHHCARAVKPIIQFIKNNPDYISKANVLCPDLRAIFKLKNLYLGATEVRNYALPDETNMIPHSASANTETIEIATHSVQRAKRELLEAEHVGKFSPDQPDASNLYAGYVWGGRKKRESPSPDQPDDANLYAGYVWGGRKKRESPSPHQPDNANLYAGYVWGGRKKREYNGEELANLENTLGENVSNEKIYQEKMAANYFKLLKKEWNNMHLSATEKAYFAEWDREEVVRISALGIVCFSDLEKTLDTVLRHLVEDQSKW